MMISQRDLLRAILELSDAVISVLDRNGKIVFLSPAFQRMTGRSFEKEKGKSPTEFIHPAEREWVAEQIRRGLDGEDIGTATCRVEQIDGTYARVSIKTKCNYDLTGRVEYLVAIFTPVSEG